ncbi:MAG: hypothetical protein FWC79_04555 [Oscillospiraceae bacterium]|nr:hypothetical protein [Oscillospiraceae bacterium]
MKTKRILTALVGFPLVVALLILGNNHVINVAFAIVAIFAIKEFFDAFKNKANPVRWIRIPFSCSYSDTIYHTS